MQMNTYEIHRTMLEDGILHLYYHPENNDCESIFGITSSDTRFHPASITYLRKDIEEQVKAITSGFDKYGEKYEDDEVYPWKGILVCREGAFVWDQGDYFMIWRTYVYQE